MKDSAHALINLYYGKEVSEQDAEKLQATLAAKYPDCDVEIYYGGQDIYYYIVLMVTSSNSPSSVIGIHP